VILVSVKALAKVSIEDFWFEIIRVKDRDEKLSIINLK
jgi:hypothetical protein